MIKPLSGFPPLPVPVLPESYDNSLSFYELLCKCWNQVQAMTGTVNALTESVTAIEQAIGDLPQMSDDVAQLQLDLAAETQARSDGDDTLYNQINQVRTLVINEYVDNQTFDETLAGGIKFNLMTKAAYNALTEYDSHTVYVVYDTDNSFKFWYMGQHATCCEPTTYPQITSDDFMYSNNLAADTELTASLSNVPEGTLLIAITSTTGNPDAHLLDNPWTTWNGGTLASNPNQKIIFWKKTATEGTNSFSMTTPADAGVPQQNAICIFAVPGAHDVTVIDTDTEIVFTDNETELDTTDDANRMFIYMTPDPGMGVALPSPAPYGLEHPWVNNYALINVIHQYHNTAAVTPLTGVSIELRPVTGLFDCWTLQFT